MLSPPQAQPVDMAPCFVASEPLLRNRSLEVEQVMSTAAVCLALLLNIEVVIHVPIYPPANQLMSSVGITRSTVS